MFTTGRHPSKGFIVYGVGLLSFTPNPGRFLVLRGGFDQLPQINGNTFCNIREGQPSFCSWTARRPLFRVRTRSSASALRTLGYAFFRCLVHHILERRRTQCGPVL